MPGFTIHLAVAKRYIEKILNDSNMNLKEDFLNISFKKEAKINLHN